MCFSFSFECQPIGVSKPERVLLPGVRKSKDVSAETILKGLTAPKVLALSERAKVSCSRRWHGLVGGVVPEGVADAPRVSVGIQGGAVGEIPAV